jgi:hypothetical protein
MTLRIKLEKPDICERWDNVKLGRTELEEQQIVDEIKIKHEIVLDQNE